MVLGDSVGEGVGSFGSSEDVGEVFGSSGVFGGSGVFGV